MYPMCRHVEASHARLAGRWCQQADQHFYRCRLARSVGAEEPEYLPLAHVEADRVDRGEAAEATREIVHVDRGRHSAAVMQPPS
jgi:hypothetical protein